MVKTLFSPSEVAHAWAHQVAPKGGARPSGAGMHGEGGFISAYWEGPTLFSYGSHFVAGFIARPQTDAKSDGLVFVTNERNSNTTNARVWEAVRATSHFAAQYRLPAMTQLLALFRGERVSVPGVGYGKEAEHYKAAVLAYVRANAAELDETRDTDSDRPQCEAALALGAFYGVRKSSIQKAIRDGLADNAKSEAEALAYAARQALRDAEWLATCDDSAWRAEWPSDPYYTAWNDKRATKQALAFAKRVRAAAKLAKAKLSKRKAETLKARAAEITGHVKETESRVIAKQTAIVAAEFAAWEAGTGARPSTRGDGLYSDAQNEAIRADERRDRRKANARLFAAWQADPSGVKRPDKNLFEAGSREREAILASEAFERQELGAAYEAWRVDNAAPRPSARLFLSGWLRETYPQAWADLSQAERDEAEAKAKAKRAEAFADWREGRSNYLPSEYEDKSGAAFVRRSRDGSELQTSQGATIPWDDAVKAFRFIKLCKAKGHAFRANGRQVRVGMYRVDSITAQGDMVAGCHRFKWVEIERLAIEQGVFALEASDSAVIEA